MGFFAWAISEDSRGPLAVGAGVLVALLLWRGRRGAARWAPPDSLQPYQAAIVLGAISLALFGATALLIPVEQPAYTPGTFTINIAASQTLQHVFVSVYQTIPGQFDLQVGVLADPPSRGEQAVVGDLEVNLPPRVGLVGCREPSCTSQFDRTTWRPALNFASVPAADSWYASSNAVVRADRFGWAANGVDAQARFPIVHLLSAPSTGQRIGVPVDVTYFIANATGYDWIGEPQPSTVNPIDVDWELPVETMASSISVTAHNPGAQQRDGYMLFFAGAFLGVAGGGVIGAVQEALSVRRRRDASTAAAAE